MSHGCQEMYIKCREGIFPHLQNAARKIHKEWLKDEKKNSILNIFWALEYYHSIQFFFLNVKGFDDYYSRAQA